MSITAELKVASFCIPTLMILTLRNGYWRKWLKGLQPRFDFIHRHQPTGALPKRHARRRTSRSSISLFYSRQMQGAASCRAPPKAKSAALSLAPYPPLIKPKLGGEKAGVRRNNSGSRELGYPPNCRCLSRHPSLAGGEAFWSPIRIICRDLTGYPE